MAPGAMLVGCARRQQAVFEEAEDSGVMIIEYSDAGERLGAKRVAKIERSEQEWWSQLTPQQFYVTRKKRTDEPFTGTYFRMHDKGLFRCVCCGTAVFSSDAKYDSGTGWPSFWQPVASENIREVIEAGVPLSSGHEIVCRRCDGHLGHVFDDGPRPTGLRYCINESSLKFVPVT